MKWEIAEKKYDDVILQILFNRGIISEKSNLVDAKKFLDPKFDSDLFDPFLLPDYLRIEEKIIVMRKSQHPLQETSTRNNPFVDISS